MRFFRLLAMVRQNMKRGRRSLLFSSVGIVVGVTSLVFFVGLGLGARAVLLGDIFPVPVDEVEVIPSTITVDGTRFRKPSLFGSSGLSEEQRKTLAELPQVSRVHPVLSLALPVMAEGIFHMGGGKRRAYGDVALRGVDPELVREDVVEGATFAVKPDDEPIPALISDRLLEVYNSSLSEAHGLPKVTRSMILGLSSMVECKLHFGRSFMGRSRSKEVTRSCQIVGFSSRAELLGGAVPLEYIRRMNALYGEDEGYSRFIVKARSPALVPEITAQVREMGLEVDDSRRDQAESVGMALAIIIALLGLVSLVVVTVAAINIAHTFYMVVYERKRELAILRALGASRGAIKSLILMEALLLGLGGGAGGVGLAVTLSWLCDLLAGRYLPDFPFKPGSYFLFPPWLLVAGVGCAILFCVVGASFPSSRAARLSPAEALSQP